jgi:long-chain acyl-CoA synthetase
MNLSEIIDRFASDTPDNPALVFEDRTITYAELLASVNKMCNALSKAGIGKGDCIALLIGNSPEFVTGYFAALRLGAVAVTLNPAATVYELSHYFADCKPKAVLGNEDQPAKVRAIPDHVDYVRLIVSRVADDGVTTFKEIESNYSDSFSAIQVDPDHPGVVIFTAGLLGKALGATLSHKNLDSNSNMLKDTCQGGPSDRGLALIPLFHAFGCAVNLLGTFKAGGSVYLVEKVDFPKLIPWLKKAQITYTGLVPMVYYGLIYHPACKDLDLKSMRIAISGGAPLSYEIYERFTEKYGIDVYHGYGLTEASPVVSWNNIHIKNKPKSVGTPIPDVAVEIHDDNGNPLPANTEGEVVVTGPNVMLGYWGRPHETSMVIRNGKLYTGDLGFLDEEGYITLTGLKKDLVITSGFNVYCQEVEEILIRHPHVAEVALIGVDDLMRGQVIEALVVPESGVQLEERELIRFCKEYLSRYKCPRKVRTVSRIIRDDHGKPLEWN